MTSPLHVALRHRYRSGFVLEVEFDHSLSQGGTTALVGASGSGKSTILRALAGLEPIDTGRICLGEDLWLETSRGFTLPPQQRDLGCLFQEYSLFPHLTVQSNIAFGLRGRSRIERDRRVAELLDLLQLAGLQRRYPHELSGGQQQRVGLARAVARRPKLLLLDEPLSALDTPTRNDLRGLLRTFLVTEQIPTVLVTHDPADVRALSDHVVVLEEGPILQAGPTADVLQFPASSQVRRLLAMPTA
ncbi:MAG: sulfate/molybdate ABC transporter ATP-binding protein [Planctomycetaceae bacterium]